MSEFKIGDKVQIVNIGNLTGKIGTIVGKFDEPFWTVKVPGFFGHSGGIYDGTFDKWDISEEFLTKYEGDIPKPIATSICLTPDGIEGEVKTFDMSREGSKEILNAEFSKLISEKFEGLDYSGEETDMTVEEVIQDAIQNDYEYCGYEVKVQVIFSNLI
jgi:hypothetical protein